MSKSLSVAFCVPAELREDFTDAVSAAGGDKTAWLVDATRLSWPESYPDARIMALVERMEIAVAALIGGKQDIPSLPYDEPAIMHIVDEAMVHGFDDGRMSLEHLNKTNIRLN